MYVGAWLVSRRCAEDRRTNPELLCYCCSGDPVPVASLFASLPRVALIISYFASYILRIASHMPHVASNISRVASNALTVSRIASNRTRAAF